MVRIRSDALTAAINPFGAELSHLEDADGRELMTNADPAFWTGRAPLLFPIVGALNDDTLRVDGGAYRMGKHGFARKSLFEMVETGDSHAVFALEDSEQTRAQYPFAFRLEAAFRLTGATLAIDITIANRGDVTMPASFGFHPALAWPLPFGAAKEAHRITFAAQEPGALKAIAADGTIAAATVPSPLQDGYVLALHDDLFAHDALVWDPVHAQSVTYGADTGPRLQVAFPDTPRLGIWTKPGARYVCIEPWHGIADPEGYTGDFRDKPGVFEVPVGGAKHIGMSITLAG
ncbi:aldose 1-epimerase family protein [Sphingomonas gellani]|nr:aldose 1-epimerase family protein [Sphingomonas gellani]